MNKLFFIVGCLILLSSGFALDNMQRVIIQTFMDKNTKDLFKVWHFLFNKEKSYSLDDPNIITKYKNFKATLKTIKEHNQKESSYKLGLNQFSDLTKEEFKKYLTRKPLSKEELKILRNSSPKKISLDDYDDSRDRRNLRNLQSLSEINWTKYINEPRAQGNCGSCWAFAAAGVVEAAHGIKNRSKIPYLSTQQLVDCETVHSNGCEGGGSFGVLDYITANGLQPEDSYPYKEAKSDKCSYNSALATRKVSTVDYCSNSNGEEDRKCSIGQIHNLLSRGALLVGIDGEVIQSYESGVYDSACPNDNHAVVLVGYGADSTTGIQHWLVRNSWGPQWGEAGHIRVKVTDSNNHSCFVSNEGILVAAN